MDPQRFDTLVSRLSSTRLTRLTALRGLAASAAALTGVDLSTSEVGAKKGETKKKWCHRGDNVAILGKTKTLTKDQRKQHKNKHAADYAGKCSASRIVAPSGGGGVTRDVSTPFTVSACWTVEADHDTVVFLPKETASSPPNPFILFGCNATGCDTTYPFACTSPDNATTGCEETTIYRLLDGQYKYYIDLASGTPPAGAVTVTLRDAGTVIDTWSSPSTAGGAGGPGWHVFTVDGATGNVTSVDDLAGPFPFGNEPATRVCV